METSRRSLLGASLAAGAAGSSLGPSSPRATMTGGPEDLVTTYLSREQADMCRAGELTNCTEAFRRAFESSPVIRVPPGRYGLSALNLPNGTQLVGAGTANTLLEQLRKDMPAVWIRSDESSGQLAGLLINNVTFKGHPAANSAVFVLEAHGAYAIWRSSFEFFAKDVYRALEIHASDANNVYRCRFTITAEGNRDIAVRADGGTYNEFDLFLTQCEGMALDDASWNSHIRAVSDNCMIFRGQNNQLWPQVEEFHARPASKVAIEDRGFGNTFFTPTVIAHGPQGVEHAFKAFSSSLFVNPQLLGRPGAVANSFDPSLEEPFTIVGGRLEADTSIAGKFNGKSPITGKQLPRVIGSLTERSKP